MPNLNQPPVPADPGAAGATSIARLEALLRSAWREPRHLDEALEALAAAHGLSAAGLYQADGLDFVRYAAGGAEHGRLPARVAVQSGGLWADALRHGAPRFLAPGAEDAAAQARAAFPAKVGQPHAPAAEWVLYAESPRELPLDARHALRGWAEVLAEAGEGRVALAAARAIGQNWAGLFRDSPVWCHTEHSDGAIAEINRAGLEVLGRERDEVIGHRLAEFCVPRTPVPPAAAEVPAGGGGALTPVEVQILPNHGTPVTMHVYQQPAYVDGVLTGGRSVLLNVTSEREMERQLVEAQKMQAVGTLTAGIAHDFNNLLTTVLGQIELLRLRHARILPEDAVERLGRMEKAGRRAAGLVSQLLVFSRHDPQQMGPVEIWAAVLATVELLRHGLPENIEIRRDSQLPAARIWGSLGQLQQALVNVAANSLAAMPEGGALSLALSLAPAPPRAGRSAPDAPGWAVLSISDTGFGMTEAVRQRAFEPFFTTKPSSENSGLGLAIVYGIVQAHRGHVEIESSPGHGTTVRMYFPLLPASQTSAPPPVAEPGGGERILLVEDDAAVADTTAQMLGSAGYRVVTAHRPTQALELLRAAAEPFDLMLTDVTMPEMTGYQLADRVQAEFGPMRTVFVTGYDFQSTPGSSSRFLLQKPINLRDLAAAVRQALAAELP